MQVADVSQVCTELNRTYNTSCLRQLPPGIQEIFTDIASYNWKVKRGNTTLMKLINNNTNRQHDHVDAISGPKTLTRHVSQKYGMIVYIFGERHGYLDACSSPSESHKNIWSIEAYLDNLFKTTNAFIDFYVEAPGYYRGDPSRVSDRPDSPNMGYLNRVRHMFYKCIEEEYRSDPSCSLVRAHFGDSRERVSSVFGGTNSLGIWTDICDYFYQDEETSSNPWSRRTFKNVMRRYPRLRVMLDSLKGTKKEVEQYVLGQILDVPWVRKELNRSYEKELITNLVTEIVKQDLDQLFSTYDNTITIEDVLNKLKTTKSSDPSSPLPLDHVSLSLAQLVMLCDPEDKWQEYLSTEEYVQVMKKLYLIIIGLNASTMDVYLLSRLFKKFSTKVAPFRGGTPYEQPEQPHNVVIYAGDYHASIYRMALGMLGFKLTNSADKISERCLDMSTFPQPFFSEPI